MTFILRQFKQIILITMLVIYAAVAVSQVKKKPVMVKPAPKKEMSAQLKDFYETTKDADVVFTYPAGMREISAINNGFFSYDYAMDMPGHGFELWLQVKSQKQSYADYQHLKNEPNNQLHNPDSLYVEIGHAQANALAGDQNYEAKIIPTEILARYNADAGKTFLLNLQDSPVTKHYKYALLITLQKNQVGTIVAVCFTNNKGAEFFKNINKVSKCLKFIADKPVPNSATPPQKS